MDKPSSDLIAGLVLGGLFSWWLVPDYVTAEQYLAAEARCLPFEGVRRVEATALRHKVHYECRDGSEGTFYISRSPETQ